jgi:hypothetical protein
MPQPHSMYFSESVNDIREVDRWNSFLSNASAFGAMLKRISDTIEEEDVGLGDGEAALKVEEPNEAPASDGAVPVVVKPGRVKKTVTWVVNGKTLTTGGRSQGRVSFPGKGRPPQGLPPKYPTTGSTPPKVTIRKLHRPEKVFSQACASAIDPVEGHVFDDIPSNDVGRRPFPPLGRQ